MDTNLSESQALKDSQQAETVALAALKDAYETGKASAFAQLASGKPILMVDEMGLGKLDFASALGWNSAFADPENGKLLSAATPS